MREPNDTFFCLQCDSSWLYTSWNAATEARRRESLTWRFVMGAFYVDCTIVNPVARSRSAKVAKLLVDTGSEYTWVPRAVLKKLGIKREKKDLTFVMANGEKITRTVGFAIIRLQNSFTIDEVVFAEDGDLLLLGARTLEGLNLTVDARRRKLVAAGPLPAA